MNGCWAILWREPRWRRTPHLPEVRAREEEEQGPTTRMASGGSSSRAGQSDARAVPAAANGLEARAGPAAAGGRCARAG